MMGAVISEIPKARRSQRNCSLTWSVSLDNDIVSMGDTVMPLRIAFDLDGVLADMDSELVRQAESLFGQAMTRRLLERETTPAPAGKTATPGAAAEETSEGPSESRNGAEKAPDNVPHLLELDMTVRQQRPLSR